MLFNSIDFVLFFFVVSGLHFALRHRYRWMLLLGASCLFYMAFVPAYILILLATIAIDFYAAIGIENAKTQSSKKLYLTLSILSVCGILFFFKYFNFFNQNAAAIASWLHWNYSIKALSIILPIGLSFHTFQSLSYVIEVYRGAQKAERHPGIYALYVMYFPQLVAGPIERPQNLLHQFHTPAIFDSNRTADGLLLALWGLFKKVVLADNIAVYVDTIFRASDHHSGATLLLASYFFAFQIYCDFSGYSDIARGVSRILGIELMHNFRMPYFSRSFSEFWSRWHISLSTWFRDYVYIPLGGNRVPLHRNLANLLIVFLLSGLWHGAQWTFVIWGGLHGVFLVVEKLASRIKTSLISSKAPVLGKMSKLSLNALGLAFVFHAVVVAWIFFRADSVGSAITILNKISTLHGPLSFDPSLVQSGFFLALLLFVEIALLTDIPSKLLRQAVPYRVAGIVALLFGVVLFGVDSGTQFIYFQF